MAEKGGRVLPSTPEEITLYKNVMIEKYKRQQYENQRLLQQMKGMKPTTTSTNSNVDRHDTHQQQAASSTPMPVIRVGSLKRGLCTVPQPKSDCHCSAELHPTAASQRAQAERSDFEDLFAELARIEGEQIHSHVYVLPQQQTQMSFTLQNPTWKDKIY